jgi:outer membrane protein
MRMKWTVGFILLAIFAGGMAWGQPAQKPLTLEESIRIALERNLALHSAREGVVGSEYRRRAAATDFLAKWGGEYGYTRYNDPVNVGFVPTMIGPATSRDIYNLSSSIVQPLFAGGSILGNYRLEKFGLDISKADVETVKRDIVVLVREGYFNILRAEKFVDVGKQAVKQFEAQLNVAKAFFEVGITPKNDLLQSEVRLANARQALVRAENDLALAISSFNILLRREINEPLSIVDILEYKPSTLRLEESLDEALRLRPEVKSAGLRVEQAKEGVRIARSGFFPTLGLSGNYQRFSDDFDLRGDLRSERWQ